ncbi:MAG: TRAP transporter permease, partial [Acidaminococcaceae bacterium]
KIAMATITALIGMWGVSVAMIGYCVKTTNMLQRILFFFGGVMLIDPGLLTDVIGITVLVATYAWQVIEKKKMNKVAA